jgi:hypothetical protein
VPEMKWTPIVLSSNIVVSSQRDLTSPDIAGFCRQTTRAAGCPVPRLVVIGVPIAPCRRNSGLDLPYLLSYIRIRIYDSR